jgi:hypothetical protein
MTVELLARRAPATAWPDRQVVGESLRWLGRASGRAGRKLRAVVVRRRLGLALFVPAFALYVTIGALLDFRYSSYVGDAQSRLANAYYVFFSRDPHLAAIGFVWNPLTSISVMPLLLLKGLWPELASRAFAGAIMSAAFMAGSVVVLHAILRDLRVRASARIPLTVLFALQPMIILYGANGMSEGLFLLCLLLSCRRLARWLHGHQTWDLVLAGVPMGFAYLTRNEAVMPSMIGAAVVVGVTAWRAGGDLRARTRAAVVNGFIFASPAAFAFLLWAALSWVIVGHPLEAFTSQYGNAAQLSVSGDYFVNARGGIGTGRYILLQLAGLAPFLPVVAVAVAWRVLRHRDLRVLAALAIPGGVVFFAVVAFLLGQTAGWLRYQIAVIPTMFVVAGCVLAREGTGRERWLLLRRSLALVAVVALGLGSAATSALTMSDKRLGHEEHDILGFVFNPSAPPDAYEFRYRQRTAEQLAAYIDAKHLPRGSVIMDTGSACIPIIVLASRHPKQFVITNDRDFMPVLADPVTFKAQYILVPQPEGLGSLNEINRTYPTLFATGAGLGVLDHAFEGGGCSNMRLYRLTGSASSAAGLGPPPPAKR